MDMTVSRWMSAAAAIALIAGCSAPAVDEAEPSREVQADEGAFAVSRALPRPGEGAMSAELEARIDLLLADYRASGPTTVDNAPARAMVLYDWGNAMKLEGQWVHPDLPALAAVVQEARFPTTNPRVRENFITAVDNFIEEFSLRRARPDAFGDITMSVLKPAIVNDFHAIEMTYTVGSEPIRTGGGIVTPNHFRFADFEYQTSDPSGPNYATIQSSNSDVVFSESTYPATGQYAARLRGMSPRLMFEVMEGELTQGDTVTVTFGDMSAGSPGLQTLHYSNSAMRYPVWILTAPAGEGGILHALPELPVELLGGSASGVQGFGPAVVGVGENIEVTIRTEDRFRNRAETAIPDVYEVSLNGKVIDRIDTNGQALLRYPVSFDAPGVHRLTYRSGDGTIEGVSSPILAETQPDARIYWGETHGHSGWAEGLGLVDNYFEFAREESRLDFITLSEHDLWLDLGEWSEMRTAVEAHHRDKSFITFMGYEWTAEPAYGGHHNVLFRKPETAVLASRQYYPDLDGLHSGLRAGIATEDVLVVPHAHQPGDWTNSDPDLERLVEIVSYHGTFEWFGKRYLDQGWEVGFIGSSDDHVGSPGYRPRAFGSSGSDNFGGLAAVYGGELDRDTVFDALHDRRAYATNGARILLKASMNDQMMGTRLPEESLERVLKGTVVGTAPIASITLIKNGEDLETIDYSSGVEPRTIEVGLQFNSQPLTRRRSYPDATFVGVLETSGMEIAAVEAPVAEALNSETEFADQKTNGAIDFRLRSGGRLNTIHLDLLAEPSSASELTIDLSQSDLTQFDAGTLEPITISASDLVDGDFTRILDPDTELHRLTARMISKPVEPDRTFEFTDESAPKSGDYYYLRIRQVDGGMAWSSPWWVGAPVSRVEP